jgi:hypothetical protein
MWSKEEGGKGAWHESRIWNIAVAILTMPSPDSNNRFAIATIPFGIQLSIQYSS